MSKKTATFLRVFVILGAVLATNYIVAYAGDTDAYFSKDEPNGRYWQMLDKSCKANFLFGLQAGINVFSEYSPIIEGDEQGTINTKNSYKCTLYVLSPKMTGEEIITKIDKFYEEEFNRNIPVFEAYGYICSQFAHTTTPNSKFDENKTLNELRSKYRE